jgi:integrase
MSLAAARAKRDELAGQVVRGQSPAREKQLEKMALGRESTVHEFAERYYTDMVLRSLKDPSAVRRYLDKQVFPAFGNKALKDVTSADVQTLVLRKRDNGQEAAAAAIRNLLKRLFDYAIVRGAAQVNPALALPTKFITTVRSRTRTLSPDEIRVYLRYLYQSNIRRQFKLALHLILLTLVRKSELLLAK